MVRRKLLIVIVARKLIFNVAEPLPEYDEAYLPSSMKDRIQVSIPSLFLRNCHQCSLAMSLRIAVSHQACM